MNGYLGMANAIVNIYHTLKEGRKDGTEKSVASRNGGKFARMFKTGYMFSETSPVRS